DRAVRMGNHGTWLRVGTRNGIFHHLAVDGNAADPVTRGVAEPYVAVAHDNRQWLAARRDATPELCDVAVRCDAANLPGIGFGKPDISVGAERDAVRPGIRCRDVEFGEDAAYRKTADLVGLFLSEPEIAIAAEHDADRRCAGCRECEFTKVRCTRIETANFVHTAFAEPEIAVRPFDADVGRTIGTRNLVFADTYGLDAAHRHRRLFDTHERRSLLSYDAVQPIL